MGHSVQMNVRTTNFLIGELDSIVQEGMFRSRSEAVNEAVRLLIRRYKLLRLEQKLNRVRKGTSRYANVTKLIETIHEEDDND